MQQTLFPKGFCLIQNFYISNNGWTIRYVQGHKYFYSIEGCASRSILWRLYFNNQGMTPTPTMSTTWRTRTGVFTANAYTATNNILLYYIPSTDTQTGDKIYLRNFYLVDLTEIFGAGNEPTAEQFRLIFRDNYYPYKPIIEKEQAQYQLAFDGFISPEIDGIKNYWDGTNYHRQIGRIDMSGLNWSTAETLEGVVRASFNSGNSSTYVPISTTKYIWAKRASWASLQQGEIVYRGDLNTIGFYDSAFIGKSTSEIQNALRGIYMYYALSTEQTMTINANGLNWKLLWMNASPTSAFAAQDIVLNASAYSKAFVVYKLDSATATYVSYVVDKDVAFSCLADYGGRMVYRQILFRDTNPHFYEGYIHNTYGASASTDNTKMIPFQIYGIK